MYRHGALPDNCEGISMNHRTFRKKCAAVSMEIHESISLTRKKGLSKGKFRAKP